LKNRVLVVDDEQGVREFYKDFLLDHGFEVLTAANAREGLRIADENELDIVIMDIDMPGLSGLDALKELREIDDKIPVLLLTAYERYKRNFASLYADEYIVKDKKPDFVLRKINERLKFSA